MTDSAESRSSVKRLRRMSERTRAMSSSKLNGFARKSSAPASIPLILSSRSCSPVISTTGISRVAGSRLICRHTSNPSGSGIENVGQHDVGLFAVHDVERIVTVVRGMDGVALLLEKGPGQEHVAGVVVDNQDAAAPTGLRFRHVSSVSFPASIHTLSHVTYRPDVRLVAVVLSADSVGGGSPELQNCCDGVSNPARPD